MQECHIYFPRVSKTSDESLGKMAMTKERLLGDFMGTFLFFSYAML